MLRRIHVVPIGQKVENVNQVSRILCIEKSQSLKLICHLFERSRLYVGGLQRKLLESTAVE